MTIEQKKENLGIKRLEAIHYYVHDLDRSKRFYVDRLDFAEVGGSTAAREEATGQRTVLFEAGDIRIEVSQPISDDVDGMARRWLKRHPDGVGTLIFEVEDAQKTFEILESRGGTPTSEIITEEADGGTLKHFAITTPFGSSRFRFVERKGYPHFAPGIEYYAEPKGGKNRLGFGEIDHITSNFETLAPAILWMKHVMGLEQYWEIAFHTNDVAPGRDVGSGLKSKVMWDPESGVKFANNEPLRPFFERSQIALFTDDQRGSGIQHAALTVGDIIPAVKELRTREVSFMPTPGTYYDMMPARLQELGIGKIDEDIEVLRNLEILVDGKGEGSYLLQIFLQDSAGTYKEEDAGPFFYEIIQRKGDKGFGGGNFRALFESIERQQQADGRI